MWQANELFENREYYLERFNKKDYPGSFEEYEKIFRVFDKICIQYYETCGDVDKLCDEASGAIVTFADSLRRQQTFKNARQEEQWQESLNLFVVTSNTMKVKKQQRHRSLLHHSRLHHMIQIL